MIHEGSLFPLKFDVIEEIENVLFVSENVQFVIDQGRSVTNP